MDIGLVTVLFTALGVGGATLLGSIIGFIFKNPSHKVHDAILSFAAGVMLCAAVVGLIVPSLEYNGDWGILVTIVGVLAGALVITIIDRFVPHLHRLAGTDIERRPNENTSLSKVMLFVIAIAIHNLPEGIAAGVGFGTGDMLYALTIAGGIALQNIPEGMVIISPMIAAGVSKTRAFLLALATGVIEIVGTLLGYFFVNISTVILPFVLAFAGGTMLYVISDEMIPETHAHGNEKIATFTLLLGFCVMLAVDFFLG
ncbi:MAG: ZIP family metal transporter [Clostridiales bacterium]|nr:ZIP family metal transporter [Clostridiales bacterium]